MSINCIQVAELILHLHSNSGCHRELGEAIGMHPSTVSDWLKIFHRRKLVRICDWKRFGNNHRWTAIWEWNTEQEKDAPKPKKLSDAERQRNMRARKSQIALNKAIISKEALT